MGQEERRNDAGGQEGFDPVTREVREGQSPSVREEGIEEDEQG